MPDELNGQMDGLKSEHSQSITQTASPFFHNFTANTRDEENTSQDDAIPGKTLRRREVSIISPLRYPGSKKRLAAYIENVIQKNGLRPALFIEPFAGGASVALQLLNDNVVERIGLMDLDPLIAAFWATVFSDETEWLIDQVETIEVTLEQWHRFKKTSFTKTRDVALKCLFLNRTSFSGILTPGAGPIGGQAQSSPYGIDCRFPRKTIIKRIRQAAALKDRVAFVWNVHWNVGLANAEQMHQQGKLPKDTFTYFDPPFFEKAEALYTYCFKDADHQALRDFVIQLKSPWILSYDSPARVIELYGEAGVAHVEMLYSASKKGGGRAAREAIITNLEKLPEENVLWRKWPDKRRNQDHQPDDSLIEAFKEKNSDNGKLAVIDG